jgi:uncharacterized protein (DUF4415 family)
MEKEKHIVRASAEAVKEMLDRGESRTDWKRVRATSQEEANRLADEEDGPLPDNWESTVDIGIPQPKQGVHIRLDADILAWFRSQRPGYQTRINSVLKAFVQARRRGSAGDHRPR